MRAATPALPMTDEQRSVLEKLIRSRTAPHRDVQRARVLLMAADGFAKTRIASEVMSRRRRSRPGGSGLSTMV